MRDWIVRFIAVPFIAMYSIALATSANWAFEETGIMQVIGVVGLFATVAIPLIFVALLPPLNNADTPLNDVRYVDKLIEKYSKEK